MHKMKKFKWKTVKEEHYNILGRLTTSGKTIPGKMCGFFDDLSLIDP